MSAEEFNASNMTWEFYLVGNSFTTDNYIKNEINTNKTHGERSLVFKVNNYKIYVKTWSEIFAEFKIRYDFLLDKLSLSRDKIMQTYKTADDVIAQQKESSAKMAEEIKLKK